MNEAELFAKAQEANSYILRGYELLKECAQDIGDLELVDLVQKQIEGISEITKAFKPH